MGEIGGEIEVPLLASAKFPLVEGFVCPDYLLLSSFFYS